MLIQLLVIVATLMHFQPVTVPKIVLIDQEALHGSDIIGVYLRGTSTIYLPQGFYTHTLAHELCHHVQYLREDDCRAKDCEAECYWYQGYFER